MASHTGVDSCLRGQTRKQSRACCANKAQLISAICALEKIHDDMIRTKGLSASIRGCKIGKWVLILVQSLVAQASSGLRANNCGPVNGSPCPALEMEQDCGWTAGAAGALAARSAAVRDDATASDKDRPNQRGRALRRHDGIGPPATSPRVTMTAPWQT